VVSARIARESSSVSFRHRKQMLYLREVRRVVDFGRIAEVGCRDCCRGEDSVSSELDLEPPGLDGGKGSH